MKLSDFDYKFPDELVAQHPLPKRAASRMMAINRAKGAWEHKHITDLPIFLKAGDVLVINDSRVIHARIFGNLMGGKPIELLLVEKIATNILPLCKGELDGVNNTPDQWHCLIKRARNYRRGDKFFFGISATAEVKGRDGDFLVVEFPKGHLERAIKRRGVPPLPPYIKREGYESYTNQDRERYQTVYSKELGSVAAPTAGLHFTDELLNSIKAKGVAIIKLTLHVGADTFAPVRTENIHEHKMHGEFFSITKDAAHQINLAREEKRRVIAVGTTTVRALESSCKNGRCREGGSKTDLFITPGYRFGLVDAIITNFHQPKSTLLMLVSAFADRDLILSAYADAIKNGYRLFSFGDCMLIE